jgi:class 3 adenylate cyclase
VLQFSVLQVLSTILTATFLLVRAVAFMRPWAGAPWTPNPAWFGSRSETRSLVFQFQGAQVLVLVLAPSLLGMRSLTLIKVTPWAVLTGVGAAAATQVAGWDYGVAWLVFTAALSLVLVRDLERERRQDFFTNYVAREGQRITERMLHAMLPRAIADAMLNKEGTQRALSRLVGEISRGNMLCNGRIGDIIQPQSRRQPLSGRRRHGSVEEQPGNGLITAKERTVVTDSDVSSLTGIRQASGSRGRMRTLARATAAPKPAGKGRAATDDALQAGQATAESTADAAAQARSLRSSSRVHAGIGVPLDIAADLDADVGARLGGGGGRGNAAALVLSPSRERRKLSVTQRIAAAARRMSGPRIPSLRARPSVNGADSMYEPSTNQVALLMFDLVGFTKLSQAIGPHKLVTMLDELYDMFDKMVERRGAYKVETIGDAFLVCCGAPQPRPAAEAALRVTKCALDMMQRVKTFKAPGGRTLQARVGIHIGTVLTGVIGTQMPRYQLFGPQVDYAMEMESSSIPGKVHASSQLLELIKGAPDITIESRRDDGTGFVLRNRAARLYTPW